MWTDMVFAQNRGILHQAVHQPITFSQLWSLTRRFKPVNKELCLHLWCQLHLYTCKPVWVGQKWVLNLSNDTYTVGVLRERERDIFISVLEQMSSCWLCVWTVVFKIATSKFYKTWCIGASVHKGLSGCTNYISILHSASTPLLQPSVDHKNKQTIQLPCIAANEIP